MPKIDTHIIGQPPDYPARLLKTGQTTQYETEHDNGYYEKGLTKRYLVLDTGQHSGACVFSVGGKIETQSHECVRDLVTGLMWARYTSTESASIGTGSDGKLPWSDSEAHIFAYAAAANVAELGGYSDWRIPSEVELASLRNMEASTAVPDSTAFPGDWWPSDTFWTSTTMPPGTANAMYVRFYDGIVSYTTKTFARWVALVRGGI